MILLAAADTLAGVADAASKVTVSIFGMTLTGSTEAYSTLYQGQLSNSAATIYTSTGVTTFIRSITVVNPDTASHTFQLFRAGTAAANAITPTFTLAAGTMAVYEDALGWLFYTTNGAVIQNPYVSTSALDVWGSSGTVAATHDRNYLTETNTTLLTTGQVYMQSIWMQAGQVCTSILIWSATTAASGPTHYNAGLYDSAGNMRATGTDKTSTAWGANTLSTFTMQTPYTVPTTGLYYVALGITVSTTVPTIKGNTARVDGAVQLATLPLCGVSTTSYASGNMPSTLGLPTAKVLTSMYAEVH